MVGMLTGDRVVRLEVSGRCQQNVVSRRINYSVTVPYSSMSSTMQNIMRMGGKVTGVQVSDIRAAAPSATGAGTTSNGAGTTSNANNAHANAKQQKSKGKGKKK